MQPPALQDITSREGVTITRSGFVRTGFDNGMGIFAQRVTIHNNTDKDIQGPVYLVLDNLNRRLVTKPAGLTSKVPPIDRPFVVPKIVPDINFAPIFSKGDSLHVDLKFASPPEGGITYTIQALAGNDVPP